MHYSNFDTINQSNQTIIKTMAAYLDLVCKKIEENMQTNDINSPEMIGWRTNFAKNKTDWITYTAKLREKMVTLDKKYARINYMGYDKYLCRLIVNACLSLVAGSPIDEFIKEIDEFFFSLSALVKTKLELDAQHTDILNRESCQSSSPETISVINEKITINRSIQSKLQVLENSIVQDYFFYDDWCPEIEPNFKGCCIFDKLY